MKKRLLCVNDSVKAEFARDKEILFQEWVVKGEKYTVREYLSNDGIVEGVLLEEIHNIPVFQPLLGREQEPGWKLDRFREIEEDEMIEEEHTEEIVIHLN